ncbi:MAG: RNA-binding S4 domain-containing protein [Gammaproteobacteria bacterium]|nr:RNA-binding S4 domain-containing protein [Gammaproteobacteria bacterium]MBU1414176.1 RNA-binding S4 domain-containing protein [Gammaproteobacteria bacterium]
MRLDKWLWAARFYKTRSLATGAVEGGKVRLNGAAVKPAREVKPGDRLDLRTGNENREVIVQGLNEQRHPAPEARLLYRETEESIGQRAQAAELRRLAPTPSPDHKGRPTKRDRRQIIRFREG